MNIFRSSEIIVENVHLRLCSFFISTGGLYEEVIWKMLTTEDATLSNKTGRYAINWPVAVKKYYEFQRRGPHWSGQEFEYKKCSNSFRTLLLSKKYQSDGALEYSRDRRVGKDRKTTWRFFQLPNSKLAAFKSRRDYRELLPQEDHVSNEVAFLIFNSIIDYFNHRADGVPFYHYVTMECTWWYFHGILFHMKLCRLTRFSWEWRCHLCFGCVLFSSPQVDCMIISFGHS